MTAIAEWQRAFLAVSTVLGEPSEAVDTALGDGAEGDRIALLAGGLRAASREVRARAVAAVLAQVAAEIEEGALA